MARIRPFAAVMPPAAKAPAVAHPPYDVVDDAEARALAKAAPEGFLHVSRAEVDLPAGVDPYSDAVYQTARTTYQRLCREVPLRADSVPCLYVYALEMGTHRQAGIVAAASVDDYENGIIKKHERTRQDKEDDRTRHIVALRSQTGPVLLTHRDDPDLARITAVAMAAAPLFDFTAADSIRHTGWRMPAGLAAETVAAFDRIPALYIADGHHRAASAARARTILRQSNPAHTGAEEYNSFLGVIFPAGSMRILPYNRVVTDLGGLTAEALLQAIGRTPFAVGPAPGAAPDRPGTIHMVARGRWHRLTFTGSRTALSPVDRLDVSLLQNHILGPLCGIDDPRTSKRIDFVGGIRGTAVLEQRAAAPNTVAFSLHPTTVAQLMDISDAGQIMPPKSTWFEPKLRDGLFVHDI